MARLIDADALEADLKRQYEEVFGNAKKAVNPDDFYIDKVAAYRANVVEAEQKGFFEYLKTRPTVNIVYCKDCVYARPLNDTEKRIYLDGCKSCRNGDATIDGYNIVMPEHFCSYGKRRE